MKIEVVRGGSGKWGAWYPEYRNGTCFAGGHVPKKAENPEEVVRRQIIAIAEGRKANSIEKAKMGGQLYEIELPDSVMPLVKSVISANEKADAAAKAQRGEQEQIRNQAHSNAVEIALEHSPVAVALVQRGYTPHVYWNDCPHRLTFTGRNGMPVCTVEEGKFSFNTVIDGEFKRFDGVVLTQEEVETINFI